MFYVVTTNTLLSADVHFQPRRKIQQQYNAQLNQALGVASSLVEL